MHASLSTSVTICTGLIYGKKVGMRLQAFMHPSFALGGVLSSCYDSFIVQLFGLKALTIWIVCINVLI